MKKLVWLLVLINVGLLAYFNKDVILPSAPKAALLAIHPEKISIVTQQQIDALPKKGVAATVPTVAAITPPSVEVTASTNPAPAPTTCYEWGVFSAANLTGAQAAVSNLSIQTTVKEQSSLEAKRFWVYKQPLKSVEAAQAKTQELKALGIQDMYIVQDARWKNAISFGVFEDEQLATKLLNELRAKGVKDVVKALRNQGKGHASLQLNKLTDTEVIELKKLKPEFPEADLKEVTCS